jgi:glucose-1-phosphate thymidylyltransferase
VSGRAQVRIVGISPAAGYAARLQPLVGSKETLDVGGRPVLEYLLERMRAGHADEIRIVTRPEKDDVVSAARALGAKVVLGSPATVAESIALGIADLHADDLVLIGFPDTIWYPTDGFRRLVALVAHEDVDVALGLFRTQDLRRSDVVVCDGERVTAIAVKPAEPPTDVIWGCAAAHAGALSNIASAESPGEFFNRLSRLGRVRGLLLSDLWIDAGTPDGLQAARRLIGRRGAADVRRP